MNYIKLTIDKYDEGLMALLALLPYESFEEDNGAMVTYIKKEEYTSEIVEISEGYINMFNATYTAEVVLPQNWNAIWESQFDPVVVEDFLRIRADFHPHNPKYAHELTINPKMSFGTGHHETTYMMALQMKDINFQKMSVLDYGCGTGVLAILASKLGAQEIIAVDIEKYAFENTIENCSINNVNNIKAIQGDLNIIPSTSRFDIILANINKNVLIDSAENLIKMISNGGILLISGILIEDKMDIIKIYTDSGFIYHSERSKGKWLCIRFQK